MGSVHLDQIQLDQIQLDQIQLDQIHLDRSWSDQNRDQPRLSSRHHLHLDLFDILHVRQFLVFRFLVLKHTFGYIIWVLKVTVR